MRFAAALVLAFPLLQAQTREPGEAFVRATGDATISAKPDEARIQIGVTTHAQTAEVAAGENANQTNMVLAELRKIVKADSDLRTSNYSIAPEYRYPKPGASPVMDGYTANNTVQVNIRDLTAVGKLIDAASKNGANTIHSIEFRLHDDRAIRAQALKEATQVARANAESMASGLNAKLGRLLSIESADAPRPVALMQRAMANEIAPTPIEPGSVDVRASVVIAFEVAQ